MHMNKQLSFNYDPLDLQNGGYGTVTIKSGDLKSKLMITDEAISFLNMDSLKVRTKLFTDLKAFHQKFGFDKDWTPTEHNLMQRVDVMAREELEEAITAIKARDRVGLIDALIDLIYFSVGTLDLMKVDGDAHWDAVQSANMEKVRGQKASRPGTNGLDVIKPEGWVAPEARHEKILEQTSFNFAD